MLRSIRWSLQLWHAGLLAVVLAGFGVSSYFGIARARYQEIDAELERMVQLLAAGLRFPPPDKPWGPPPEEWFAGSSLHDEPHEPWGVPPEVDQIDISSSLARRFGDGPAGTFYYVIWNSARGVLKASRPGIDVPYPETAPPDEDADAPAISLGPDRKWRDNGNDRQKRMPVSRSPLAHASTTATEVGTNETTSGNMLMGRSPAVPGIGPGASGASMFRSLLGPHGPPHLETPTIRHRDEFREAFVHGPFGTQLLVGRSIHPDQAALRRMALLLSAIGTAVLVVGLAGGWILSLRAVRPILAITMAAQEISASNLSHRINVAGTQSELGTLAAVLNDAFDRLETAFQRQMRFTADASHELRTPLAVIHTNAQLALSRERSAEEYRKTIEACLRASTRMKSLVDSLLILARADAGRLVLDRSSFVLGDIVAECIAMVRPLADERHVSVKANLQSAHVSADATRIAQVVTNLLTNAIRYNREGGCVQVTTTAIQPHAVLVIADTGVGIPPDGLPHVFERFYRANAARSRDDGGSGLGLAICKTIVEAHGGKITAHSEAGCGTTFTVRLPLAPAEDHRAPADCPARP